MHEREKQVLDDQAAMKAPAAPSRKGASLRRGSGQATPMMEQFIEIKAANPDSLLFYRMGDFYELFFDDAVTAARALGITLTKRGQHMGEDIPMCGVPVHSADDYLHKLIALGHRVAVCEQIEDPAEARKRGSKSVVKRDVIRLVTAGTLTEDSLLDPGEANYLMALSRVRGSGKAQFGLAWADISTGTFRVAQSSFETLLGDILRIDPSELIVSETLFHDSALKPVFDALGRIVTPQPSVLFDSVTAQGRIERFFQVAALDGFGLFSRAELSAVAATIAYVEKTQCAERPPLGRPERQDDGAHMAIDPATRTNLELTRTLTGQRQGSLLAAIDRTVTHGGARLLAERLTAPLSDPTAIEDRLEAVAWFVSRPDFAQRLRDGLKLVPDMPRALSRLALNRGGPRDLMAIAAGLEAARHIANALGDQEPPAEIARTVAALDALPADLAPRLMAALADDLPLLKRDGGFVRDGHHDELDEMRALRDQSRRVIAALQGRYAEETGVRTLKIKHNNVLGFFIEVSTNQAAALSKSGPDGADTTQGPFIHRQSLANAMRFTTVELAELEKKIANAAARALAIELALFDRLSETVVGFAEPIKAAARALSAIDVASALARLAEEQGYCRPIVDRTNAFAITAGRHPVVEQVLRRQAGEVFVANDCDISGEESGGAIWLVTGPNMGGKSTFLRQNALIAVMAQMGSFVPAGAAHIGIVDRLFSRVGASDDLARGRSTFMVEMVETAAILNQASSHSLVILDEIGRGTATFDGLSIAWAAVEHLHESNRCRALFATHFHELTALSERLTRLSNVTMRVKEWKGDVVFLHEVGPGAADRSYGIQVARLAGLPDAVIERARLVLARLEEGDRKNPAHELVEDLPLFQIGLKDGETQPSAAPAKGSGPGRRRASSDPFQPVIEALGEIEPDDMTPRDALEAVYRLKAVLAQVDDS